MRNGSDGGGLGGKRGGDCGCDLRLKGCGGLCICHPKRNNKCGLELAKAAAVAESEKPKDYLTCRRNSEPVAGVKLDNNTAKKRKVDKYDNPRRTVETVAGVKLDNITANKRKVNKYDNPRRTVETVAGVKLDNNTGGTTKRTMFLKTSKPVNSRRNCVWSGATTTTQATKTGT
jgi:hypothetical protein